MISQIIKTIKGVLTSRIFYIYLVFIGLAFVLSYRLYSMQIVQAGSSESGSNDTITVMERYIPATRGLIYDSKGRLLAYNELRYAVFLQDTDLFENSTEKNAMISRLCTTLRKCGFAPELSFAIEIAEDGSLQYNIEGNALLRFKKNAYGLRSVKDLDEVQKASTAEELFDFLCHGNKSTAMFNVSDDYSLEEKLDIVMVRYYYFTSTDKSQQYIMASNVDEKCIAAIMEASGDMPGVSISQQTRRVYNYSTYFSHILGYTGLINENELEEFKESGKNTYTSTDHVGKMGLELTQEEILAGKKGVEKLVMRNGKIISTEIISEPVPGQNIYLTLDAELQKDYYDLLEKRIAEVLVSSIVSNLDYGTRGESSDYIILPVYEVYYALLKNHTLDINHFYSTEATELEKSIYRQYENYDNYVREMLAQYVAWGNTKKATTLTKTMRDYLDYFYDCMHKKGYFPAANVNENDLVYLDYFNNRISFYEYIVHAIDSEWIDLGALGISGQYLTTEEIYKILMEKTFMCLDDNSVYDLMIYRTLIFEFRLTAKQICLLLFDQNVLEYNGTEYYNLNRGVLNPCDFIKEKIENLDITPAQLALQPCSGAVVQTDTRTGEYLAVITYPSFDNNNLANKIDWDYYQSLVNDYSSPMYSRATQVRTPTGSTIKPMIACLGDMNKVVTPNESIYDEITFTKVDPSPSCWVSYGHKYQNMAQAITNSCNYYFFEIGYRLGMKGASSYSDQRGIDYFTDCAKMFGFTEGSGIEIPEASSEPAKVDIIRAVIGYGNKFTIVSMAKYVTAIATKGTVYDMTIIKKITDKDDNVVYTQEPQVVRKITSVSSAAWKQIHEGMKGSIQYYSNIKKSFQALPGVACGKTGTAEISNYEPASSLHISFYPMNNPEIALACYIGNGHSGSNSGVLAGRVMCRYYNISTGNDGAESEIIAVPD